MFKLLVIFILSFIAYQAFAARHDIHAIASFMPHIELTQ